MKPEQKNRHWLSRLGFTSAALAGSFLPGAEISRADPPQSTAPAPKVVSAIDPYVLRAIETIKTRLNLKIPATKEENKKLDKEIKRLVGALGDDDFDTREQAGKRLKEIGWRARPELRKALSDPDLEKRRRAKEFYAHDDQIAQDLMGTVSCLAHIAATTHEPVPGLAEAVPVLVDALDVKNIGFRREVIRALQEIGPNAKAATPALIAVLKDKDVDSRRSAVWALGKIGPDGGEVVLALIELLKNKDEDQVVKHDAVEALGRIGPAAKKAVPELIEALKNNYTKHDAAVALGKIGTDAKSAVQALIAALGDEDGLMKAQTIEALGNIGPEAKEAVPALIEMLKDATSLKVIAAETLGKIGPAAQTAVPELIEVLKNEANRRSKYCTIRTVVTLGQIGPGAKEAVPTLINLLKDASITWVAAIALGRIGPEAKEAVEPLKVIARDFKADTQYRTRGIRKAAAEAIEAIEQKKKDKKFDPAQGQSRSRQMNNPDIPLYRRNQLQFQDKVIARRAIKVQRDKC